LGSTRVLTDLDGEVVATYTYDAFGELLDSTGEVENDYLFAGEPFDGELEQYYLRQRFYEPGIGRFTRRDTYEGRIGEPITLHKYVYAHNNPINLTDPSGLTPMTDGNKVHNFINGFFIREDPVNRRADFIPGPKYTIGMLTKELGVFQAGRNQRNGKRPDLVDLANREIFEIKPHHQFALGKRELNQYYLNPLNSKLTRAGRSNELWSPGTPSTFTPPPVWAIPPVKIVRMAPPREGVIIYKIINLKDPLIVAGAITATAVTHTF